MDLFLGKWVLKKDIYFGEFLKFSGVPWLKRRIAEHNKIKLIIEKWNNVYIKSVKSPVYNTEEIVKLDDQYREYGNSFKKFCSKDDVIHVDVKYKDDIVWKEEISIKDEFLITKYIWIKNNERHIAIQFFSRN